MKLIELLTDIVLIVTIFQLFMLAIVLIIQKTKNNLSRNFLVAFLLSKAFLMVRWFVFRFEILEFQSHLYLYFSTCAAFFLLAPMLYFYIKSLCYKDYYLQLQKLSHIVPFVFSIILALIHVRIQTSVSGAQQSGVSIFFAEHYWNIFWTINFIQIFSYIIVLLRTILAYQKRIKKIYSSIETINLEWLVTLLAVIFMHWLFVVSKSLLSIFGVENEILLRSIDLFSITIFLVFTTILVLKGLNQLKIFSGIEGKLKYANLKLDEVENQKYSQHLKKYMEAQKPYLIPSLTIDDLSEKVSIPSWQLSQIINDSFNQNFFNFVNSYRIEEVKNMFSSSKNKKKTVLEILYEAGFNSKSTFNDVFKKHTGMTPTEFKKVNTRGLN